MARDGRPAVEVVAQRLDATVGEIAGRAGLGVSTVSKALAVLEAAGRAGRAPGGRDGGRRLPDRWAPTSTTNAGAAG